MKEALQDLIVGTSGDFGAPRTPEALCRWITRNGGVVSADATPAALLRPDTTHLVCTQEDWTAKAPKVKQALKLGSVKIVSWDWLEDSLLKGRRLRERPYLLAELEKSARRRKRERARAVQSAKEKFDSGCAAAEEDLFSSRYHVYRDETLFEYNVLLFRADPATNRNERHQLKLFESHALPHLYAASTRYTRSAPRQKPTTASTVLAPHGSFFADAFAAFRAFFEQRVGYKWEDRLDAGVRARAAAAAEAGAGVYAGAERGAGGSNGGAATQSTSSAKGGRAAKAKQNLKPTISSSSHSGSVPSPCATAPGTAALPAGGDDSESHGAAHGLRDGGRFHYRPPSPANAPKGRLPLAADASEAHPIAPVASGAGEQSELGAQGVIVID